MSYLRFLFCLGVISLLAVGCTTSQTAQTQSTPTTITARPATPCVATTQPGWTIVLPGDNL